MRAWACPYSHDRATASGRRPPCTPWTCRGDRATSHPMYARLRRRPNRWLPAAVALLLAVPVTTNIFKPTPAAAATVTTAWRNGAFALDTAGVVSRSNVVIGKANSASTQFLPLGNGSLGVAEWAANGFTAQDRKRVV